MLQITAESSKAAQDQLLPRIQNWMRTLLENDDYRHWKNRQIKYHLLYALDQDETLEEVGDFSFDPAFEKEISLVSGYFQILSTLGLVKQCEYYFRRFAFRDLPVSRHEHLATCCELFASRVY